MEGPWALAESKHGKTLVTGGEDADYRRIVLVALVKHASLYGAADVVWVSRKPYIPGIWPHGTDYSGLRVFGPCGSAEVRRWEL